MKKITSMTLPEELIKSLKERAEKEDRSVSNMAAILIQKGLEKQKTA
jgi:hypothetical protein